MSCNDNLKTFIYGLWLRVWTNRTNDLRPLGLARNDISMFDEIMMLERMVILKGCLDPFGAEEIRVVIWDADWSHHSVVWWLVKKKNMSTTSSECLFTDPTSGEVGGGQGNCGPRTQFSLYFLFRNKIQENTITIHLQNLLCLYRGPIVTGPDAQPGSSRALPSWHDKTIFNHFFLQLLSSAPTPSPHTSPAPSLS